MSHDPQVDIDCDLPDCDITPDCHGSCDVFDGVTDVLWCASDATSGDRTTNSKTSRRERRAITLTAAVLFAGALGVGIYFYTRDETTPENKITAVYNAAPLDFQIGSKAARIEREQGSENAYLLLKHHPNLKTAAKGFIADKFGFGSVASPYDFYLDIAPFGPSANDRLGTLLIKGSYREREDLLFDDLDPQGKQDAGRRFEDWINEAYNSL